MRPIWAIPATAFVMAQAVGAALWHMWHYHGVYGFKHPDPDYPFGIRPKRLPDWIPGEAARPDVKVPWIIVDRLGRRYMNEYQPYTQDTTWRAMAVLDGHSMSYLRIPSYMIMDEPGRGAYPIVSPTFNDRRFKFAWSEDDAAGAGRPHPAQMQFDRRACCRDEGRERCSRRPLRGGTRPAIAAKIRVHGRPPTSMLKIATPPFYCAEVWPVCSNTHGGPVHDAEQRVLECVRRAHSASVRRRRARRRVWSSLHSGGNLAECFVGGWTAAATQRGSRRGRPSSRRARA